MVKKTNLEIFDNYVDIGGDYTTPTHTAVTVEATTTAALASKQDGGSKKGKVSLRYHEY